MSKESTVKKYHSFSVLIAKDTCKLSLLRIVFLFLFFPDEILQILSSRFPQTLTHLISTTSVISDSQRHPRGKRSYIKKFLTFLLALLHSLSYQGKVRKKKHAFLPDKNSQTLQQGDKLVCCRTCWEQAMTQHYSLPALKIQCQMDYLISVSIRKTMSICW